jgi:glycosyltransferase involved in cell wall biosynthesis
MSARPTILVVSNHGEIVGGGEISLLTLLGGLDRSRWEPILVVPGDGEMAARGRSLGVAVEVVPLPSVRRPTLDVLQGYTSLRRLVRSRGANLLHANGSRAMLYAGPVGRITGRPVIWHVRIADPEPFLDRALLWLADAVVVNSGAVARRFSWAPAEKIHCIHNGVDLRQFSPRPPSASLRTSLGIPEQAPVVGSVGRFVPFKGYRVLLEAARVVAGTLPGVHWLLVGDGEQRGELEAYCNVLGLGSQVRFVGWREDVPEILALCDVFALPSLGEHFGRVLIEAMAMAKAVVATDAGGVPEIVVHDECGLLVPPGEPQAMAEALLALLCNPARSARLGQAGRRRAEARFSIARHVEAVETVYAKLRTARRGYL